MTKKELAHELYQLYCKKGILHKDAGCGEEEWVRRTLYGCGSAKPERKSDLIQTVKRVKKDLREMGVEL